MYMTNFTELVAGQRDYYLTQATKPYGFRRAQLMALKGWIEQNEQAILDALNADLGK